MAILVGSTLMLMLMSRDLQIIVSALRQLDIMVQSAGRRGTIVQLLDHSTVETWEIMNFVLSVNSGILFVVGSALFLPTLYAKNANLGCTLFIIGCLCQLIAALWDTARMLTQGEKKTMKDVWILFLPAIPVVYSSIQDIRMTHLMPFTQQHTLSSGACHF